MKKLNRPLPLTILFHSEERLLGLRRCNKSRWQVSENLIEADKFRPSVPKVYIITVDLHVVRNVWFASFRVSYVVRN